MDLEVGMAEETKEVEEEEVLAVGEAEEEREEEDLVHLMVKEVALGMAVVSVGALRNLVTETEMKVGRVGALAAAGLVAVAMDLGETEMVMVMVKGVPLEEEEEEAEGLVVEEAADEAEALVVRETTTMVKMVERAEVVGLEVEEVLEVVDSEVVKMARVDVAEDSAADLAAEKATMTIKMAGVGAVVLAEEEAEGLVVDPAAEGLEEAMIIKTREETEKNVEEEGLVDEEEEEIKRNQVTPLAVKSTFLLHPRTTKAPFLKPSTPESTLIATTTSPLTSVGVTLLET